MGSLALLQSLKESVLGQILSHGVADHPSRGVFNIEHLDGVGSGCVRLPSLANLLI